jgi:hypothetical protein
MYLTKGHCTNMLEVLAVRNDESVIAAAVAAGWPSFKKIAFSSPITQN